MDIEEKINWLRPERIQKLYDGQKSHFGMNRLYIIGIGRHGTDCALRCMHLTQKRFGSDPKKVRFLFIGSQNQLEESSFEGSTPSEGDVLPIIPEEAIYKYLNNPEKLPEYALGWFDQGLKNYSPAAPVYGLSKRQCGRIALFHNLKQLMKLAGNALTDFGGSDKPIDIILTGNLGDTFFGGMFIDLAYIMNKIFEVSNCPVKVNGYLFAADTAALVEDDARDLGGYAANTIVSKSELDKFQCQRKRFTQKYSKTFEVDSDKPPFNACFLVPAAKNYDLTMSIAAEKILNRMEILFSKDDEAERIMSYNMLKSSASHDFRYLACGVSGAEIPTGKIMSYLGIKLFTRLNRSLHANSVGEMLLKRYAGMVSPTVELVASKSGNAPSIVFDENSNAAFSVKSVKSGDDTALSVVEEYVAKMKQAVLDGGPVCVKEISDSIISDCEAAKTDFAKGPFYAQELLKKCFAEIRLNSAKIKADQDDMSEQVQRTSNLERAALKKVKTTPLFVNKAVEQYLFELKEYSEAKAAVAAAEPMISFYQQLNDRLMDYYTNTLQKAIEPFEQISVNQGGVIEGINEDISDYSCIMEAFSLNDENIRNKLDQLAESVPKERLERYFKEFGVLNLPDDETALAKAVVKILRQCFEEQLSMNFNEMCEYFEIENGVSESIKSSIENSAVKTPVSDSFSITRVVCPKAVRQEDIADIRKQFKGVQYIWNGSVCAQTTVAASICGGVQLEQFDGYQQWENMHYAYANDSLKKHGLRIFG